MAEDKAQLFTQEDTMYCGCFPWETYKPVAEEYVKKGGEEYQSLLALKEKEQVLNNKEQELENKEKEYENKEIALQKQQQELLTDKEKLNQEKKNYIEKPNNFVEMQQFYNEKENYIKKNSEEYKKLKELQNKEEELNNKEKAFQKKEQELKNKEQEYENSKLGKQSFKIDGLDFSYQDILDACENNGAKRILVKKLINKTDIYNYYHGQLEGSKKMPDDIDIIYDSVNQEWINDVSELTKEKIADLNKYIAANKCITDLAYCENTGIPVLLNGTGYNLKDAYNRKYKKVLVINN